MNQVQLRSVFIQGTFDMSQSIYSLEEAYESSTITVSFYPGKLRNINFSKDSQ